MQKIHMMISCAAVAVSAMASGAFGQTAQNVATGAAPDDIIVTAQRRSERLERTPVAVSVLSEEALAKQQIRSEADLQTAVPGLLLRSSNDSNQLDYVIRGQAVDAFTQSQPAVLPYVNEVSVPSGNSSVFYDLGSVQVLKGPQGTLFGRNTTGGAVLYTTAKPTEEFGGYVVARGGNYKNRQFEGAVNLPIVPDQILVRAAGFYQTRHGYQRNLFTDQRVGDDERYGGRLSITLRPSDALENQFVISYNKAKGSSTAGVPYSADAPGTGSALFPSPLFFGPTLDSVFGPGAWAAVLAAHPGYNPGGLVADLAAQKARGPFEINANGVFIHRSKSVTMSNITTLEIGANTQIKNIFGYSRAKSLNASDADGSTFTIQENTARGKNDIDRNISDELQLVGAALEGNLSYVAGLYYFSGKSILDGYTLTFDLAPFIPVSPGHSNTARRSTSYAGYAQGTYDLSEAVGIPGLGATVGVRYTSEKVSSEQRPGSNFYNLPAPNRNYLSKVDKRVNWQFGLQDQVNSHLLLYAVTRRSFRSGGFNGGSAPVDAPASLGGAAFDPEIVTDIEIGAKFKGSVGGMPTRFSIAAYNSWIKDIQRAIYNQNNGIVGVVTINVPEAQVTGIEIDGEISLTPWLRTGGSMVYTDGRFTKPEALVYGIPSKFGPYPSSPKWIGSAFLDATFPLTESLGFSARGDFTSQSSYYFSSLNASSNPGSEIRSYTVANVRIGIEDEGAGWSLSATVKNLFDKTYYSGGFGLGSVLGYNIATPGAPRTFVAEVRYKF
ncbi:TonB-dependent receptor [Rhizorhabdus argentea]|uniref:TonB-dependent receptor n=1 Tax=Rhizorhabdus argentea TaxID=1387174 RepID=UPI0030ED3B5F